MDIKMPLRFASAPVQVERYPRFVSYGDCPLCGGQDTVTHSHDRAGWHFCCSECGDSDETGHTDVD